MFNIHKGTVNVSNQDGSVLLNLTELFVQAFGGKEEWSAAWVVLGIYIGTILQQVKGNILGYM